MARCPGGAQAPSLAWLLRAWREQVVGERAVAVAARLGVGRSTLSNWESGLRCPDSEHLGALDQAYGARGALVELASALGSPEALDPARLWWHNYRPGGGPVWAWLRPAGGSGRVRAEFSWGPLGAKVQHRCGPSGVVVGLGVSVANPPVRVDLDRPGWVDFGHGRLPGALGIPIVGASSHLVLSCGADQSLASFASALKGALGSSWAEALSGFIGGGEDLVARVLGEAEPPEAVADLSSWVGPNRAPGAGCPGAGDPGAGGPQDANRRWSGPRYKALREARLLSQAAAARRASAMMPSAPVSDDQVGLLEAGGNPRVEHLGPRLDVVYGAEGASVAVAVGVEWDGRVASVSFPPWWQGPVWVRLAGRSGDPPGEVELRWWPWQKRVLLRPGAAMSTRKPPGELAPLRIRPPRGWSLGAGLGAYPGAVDINERWQAIDASSARSIFSYYHGVYLRLFGRTRSELAELIRSQASKARS